MTCERMYIISPYNYVVIQLLGAIILSFLACWLETHMNFSFVIVVCVNSLCIWTSKT